MNINGFWGIIEVVLVFWFLVLIVFIIFCVVVVRLLEDGFDEDG